MPKANATWKEANIAGLVLEPGSAAEYETGTWRVQRPVHDAAKCTHCMICWVYCPDVAITRNEHNDYVINYDYCKGCGMCAEECPREAIAIEEELKCKK